MVGKKIIVFETEPHEAVWMVDKEGTVYRYNLTNIYKGVKFIGVKSPFEEKIYTFEELIKSPTLAEQKYFVIYEEKDNEKKFLCWAPGGGVSLILKD